MNLKKRIISLGLAATVLVSTVLGGEEIAMASDNGLKIVGHMEFGDSVSESGYLSATRVGVIDGEGDEDEVEGKYTLSTLPKSFMDSRKKANKKFPATRNQGEYGTCWAFSSVAMTEFNLIKKGKANKKVDYSELQLAYFTYNSVKDPLNGFKGDKNRYNDYYELFQLGGNRYMSSRAMSSWIGLIDESTMPYSKAAKYSNNAMPSKYAYKKTKAILRDAHIISYNPQKLAPVKKAIQKYGSVGIDYSGAVTNSYAALLNYKGEQYYSQYCPYKYGADHAVTVVGWDDTFPATNFATPAPANGAWLVRNSWADCKADANSIYGYFWLSYYDATIAGEVWAFDAAKKESYLRNYQYDGGNFVNAISASSLNCVANVFTSKGKEKLKSVVISNWYTKSDKYTIEIYKNVKNAKKPTSGKKVATLKGTIKAGQYTINLKKPVTLKKGEKFAVVLKKKSKFYDIDMDANISGRAIMDVTASGHSFYKIDGKWYSTKGLYIQGIEHGDFSIKALTVSAKKSKKKKK